MGFQPWRRKMRGQAKMTLHTSSPISKRSKASQFSKFTELSTESSSSTHPPTPIEKTTSHPNHLDETTTWWPSGIYLGHRPPRTHLPLHIINPDLFKWERKFPKIWFRTGGTRFTYAPEVVNYPVTFNWSIPKDKRVDKYTEKPDWPLNSPLFGSNQVYDYLEEVTLPPPPVSGETEFPHTTPQPWWTFPPWWQKKVKEEEKYGKTIRPKEAVYYKTTTAKMASTTNIPAEMRMHKNTTNVKIKPTPTIKVTPSKLITHSTFQTPSTIAPVTNVVHHRGPWWKLTVVEHHNPNYEASNKNIKDTQRNKRSINKHKPLVRQNAIRRKRKMKSHFFYKNNPSKRREENNNHTSLSNIITNNHPKSFAYSKQLPDESLIKCLLINYLLRTYFKDAVETASLSKITKQVLKEHNYQNLPTSFTTTKGIPELNDIHKLQNLILTKINEYYLTGSNLIMLKDICGAINKEIIKKYFFQKEQPKRVKNTGKMLLKNPNLKININKANSFTTNYENRKSLFGKSNVQSDESTVHFLRTKREDSPLSQNGEKVKIDLNKATNWSSQSMETVLTEVVNEIPMKTIRTEVKKGIFTELHTNKIRDLGRKDVNTEVISKMAEFEAENECFGIDKETDNSVKNLIQKLLQEVLFTLRGNKWMRDSMIKVFEDGYSVKSVLEAVVNELSIESILDAMGKEGLNITKSQKDMVLSEFKNYKPALTKALEKEISLWDSEVSKNSFPLRRKRSVQVETSQAAHSVFLKKEITSLTATENLEETPRGKRNIYDINEAHSSSKILNDENNDLNIDKEISNIKKSSLPDDEKIKKLKKHLRWLQSQTENPSDIVFPENFEEGLMITESYDDEKSIVQRVQKKRYQWSVRTKKPTVRTVTFIPKIRLARGKIFVPLTTTEEQLIIPTTSLPVSKRKKMKSAISRKKVKLVVSDQQEVTDKSAMRPFLLKTKTPDKKTVKYTSKPKPLRRLTRKRVVTSVPETTFATLRTFRTMKFGKSTQKQVISLQEFLKRRNEYRREKEEVMWNKNFLYSSGGVMTTKETPTLLDVTEENEYSTDEEEELSFDAKLSGEIKASDFTLRPLSDFLFTKPTKPHTAELKRDSDVSAHILSERLISTPKRNRTFTPNRNRSLKYNSWSRNSTTTHKNISRSMCNNREENRSNSVEGNGKRKKRNILQLQSDSLLTYKHSSKDNEEKVSEVDDGTTTQKLDDSLIGAKQNISRRELELKIKTNSKFRGNAMLCPNTNILPTTNGTASSFERYQQEHKKWFGVRRRGVPVNNYDIDWDQMRRKLEVQELSVWQKQKGANKFDGKELRKYWDVKSKTEISSEITTFKNYQPNLEMYYDIPQNTKTIMFANTLDRNSKNYSPFIKNYRPDADKQNIKGNKNIQREILEPPFGKADKDGKTAFGRLYEEPKKRHYRVFDNRDAFFDEKDIKDLANNTYSADFRIMTHRKTQWHNRTFDPNFIFTQGPVERNRTITDFRQLESNKHLYDGLFLKATSAHSNESKIVDSDFHNYVTALKENRFMSLRPKHQSFKDKDNNTVIINQENVTFILQRSKRIPMDNNTDLDAYKAYRRSRKRFYNKTIDIVFSYYIFHKFKCGNFTRDLGYGRMSNVVNRWYNRTFIPKYRPDMFYVHNRYKAGKEFNFFRNEYNILHSLMSEGTFDPSKWGHVLTSKNNTRSDGVGNWELNGTAEANKWTKEKIHHLNSNHDPPLPVEISTQINNESPVKNLKPNFEHKQNLNTSTLKFSIRRSQFHSTRPPFTSVTKKSFFKAVKDKGFVFLKSLFGIKNKKNDASK